MVRLSPARLQLMLFSLSFSSVYGGDEDPSKYTHVDLPRCYDALEQSDRNPLDWQLDFDEYFQFLQLMGLPQIYEERPLSFTGEFTYLACLCEERGGSEQCCLGESPAIDISPLENRHTDPSWKLNELDEEYLHMLCKLTEEGISEILADKTASPDTPAPNSSPGFGNKPDTPNPPANPPIPTPAPTSDAPTPAPTSDAPERFVRPMSVEYRITVSSSSDSTAYVTDLVAAMDLLAPQVVHEVQELDEQQRRLLSRNLRWHNVKRHLQTGVVVQLPSSIISTEPSSCPEDVALGNFCKTVNAGVTLVSPTRLDTFEEERYRQALTDAISEGRLQTELENVRPDSPTRILPPTSAVDPPQEDPPEGDDNDGVSTAVILGIVIALIWPLAVLGYFIVSRVRKHKAHRKNNKQFSVIHHTYATTYNHRQGPDSSEYTGDSYDDRTNRAGKDLESFNSAKRESKTNVFFGIKPLLGSEPARSLLSDSHSEDGAAHTSLSAIAASIGALSPGAAAVLAAGRKHDDESVGSDASHHDWYNASSTHSDPIESLEAQAFSPDAQIESDTMVVNSVKVASSCSDNAFSDSFASSSNMESPPAMTPSNEDESDSSDADSPSEATPKEAGVAGDIPSVIQEQDEIHTKLESLVRLKVPGEINNVDEMMLQFKGREEELLQSLRAMPDAQEPKVTKKPQVQRQKSSPMWPFGWGR